MIKNSIAFLKIVILALFVVLSSGCFSVPESPSPRFYMLQSASADKVTQKYDIADDTIIVIGPVKIPEYLNRPQIVTQDDKGMLSFSQFDRWGESLDAGIARAIIQNLHIMLPAASVEMFPCNFAIPLKYQVIVDIIQLNSRLDKNLSMTAQWSIIDSRSDKMLFIKRSEYAQPVEPGNYAGLVNALSAVCASLSNDIALTVASLPKQRNSV